MTWDKFKYRLDFFMYPAVVLAMLYLSTPLMILWPFKTALAIVGGFVMWTFAEYWIHRVVLHGPYWMAIHERHHTHPKEETVFPLFQVPFYFAVIYWLVFFGFGRWHDPVFAGVIVGYIVFFTMHHLMHMLEPATLAKWPWLEDFASRHNAHHKVTNLNYGITTDFWDKVFRTYRPRRAL